LAFCLHLIKLNTRR